MRIEIDKELLGDYALSLSHGSSRTVFIKGTKEQVMVKRK